MTNVAIGTLVQQYGNIAIEITSLILLVLLCAEVLFRTAMMTWRAMRDSYTRGGREQ
jgi:hypothetical protein